MKRKWRVFVTRKIPDAGLKKLEEKCEIEVNPENRVLTKEEVIRGLQGKDGLLCLLTDKIDREIILSNPNLKVISNYAVGYDNIDVDTATKRHIMVTNTPGVLTQATADLTWALILSVARRVVEADKFTREGKFKGWAPLLFLGSDVYGKTLGIIGTGRIGTAVAMRSRGFDMIVLYTDKKQNEKLEKELKARRVSLKELLINSDFVSIHVPLTRETIHLIGERELNLMKPTAYIINTSRGPIIDEKALVNALKEKKIAGAGLDVYEREPELSSDLVKLDNVVLLPHIGSATYETRNKMAILAAENLIQALEGKKPPNLINPEVLR